MGARTRPGGLPLVALAVVVVAVSFAAEAGLSWSSDAGAVDTSVAEAPLQFQAGAGKSNYRHVKQMDFTDNNTGFTALLKPKAGATTVVEDVIRLTNHDDAARSVTLTATQVTNPNVEAFNWTIVDGSTVVARFDYLAASPSASFTMGAGVTYEMDLTVDLASGSGNHNAAIDFGLQLEVT